MAYTIRKETKRDGVYYLAAWRAKDITGKSKVQYERYTGPDGKRGAQKLAVLREAEASNQVMSANRNLTFSDYILNTWLPRNTLGQAYSTKYSKERISLDLSEIIGPKPLGEITALDFSDVQIKLSERGLATSTIGNAMKVMKRAMKDAYSWNLIENRPWEGVKPIKQRKSPPRVVTREQALSAEKQLRDSGDVFSADLILILTYTGMRLSEALGLHWEDIDWDRGTARIWRITARTDDPKNRIQVVETPKTSAGNRTLPLPKPVLEMLERRKASTNHYLVFPDPKGRPLYSSTATKPISKTFRDLGIRGTAHGLRHGAITFLLEQGMPLNQVSKLAGHESSDITAKVYLAWADDNAAIDAMRDILGG